MNLSLPYIVYSDGACSGNPGPGGWGAVIGTPDGMVRELGGRDPSTTNNRMELTATIEALRSLDGKPGKVIILTDSMYVIRGCTEWIHGWRRRGWKTAEGKDVLNRELWESLSRLAQAREKNGGLEWRYVRGHVGHAGNERADSIAVGMAQNKRPALYHGPAMSYAFDIDMLPPEEPLPEMRPREAKAAAHSYLSYVDGVAMRHASWAECERRVKGRSGARFKKTKDAAD